MKTGTILVVAWLCFGSIQAQQIIEKHIDFSGKESLSLKIQIADSINVQTWNKNEVYVKASVNINENKDNDAYVTSFDETGKTVVVNAKFKDKYFKGKIIAAMKLIFTGRYLCRKKPNFQLKP